MIIIDSNKCIGCGLCVRDCFPGALTMEERNPRFAYSDRCIGCGHCIAVCPTEAVSDDTLDMNEVLSQQPEKTPENLLLSMQMRRSCRHFTAEVVSEHDLNMILEAARYCPTAKNLQGTRYIAVKESISELLDAALEGLGHAGRQIQKTATDPNELRRANNFINWSEIRRTNKNFDPLFFHAPLVLMFVSDGDVRDPAAAASYAELMAYHLGLGCLYSGYFTACSDISPKVREILGLNPEEKVVRCLVLGHPDVKFLRSVPRKPVDLTRI